MPESIEVTRLKQAIEQFEARKPRDASPSLLSALAGVNKELGRTSSDTETSPGHRAAEQSSYGTGVPLKYAAQGPDKPSPGQKAARGVSDDIRAAASRIMAEHKS